MNSSGNRIYNGLSQLLKPGHSEHNHKCWVLLSYSLVILVGRFLNSLKLAHAVWGQIPALQPPVGTSISPHVTSLTGGIGYLNDGRL